MKCEFGMTRKNGKDVPMICDLIERGVDLESISGVENSTFYIVHKTPVWDDNSILITIVLKFSEDK